MKNSNPAKLHVISAALVVLIGWNSNAAAAEHLIEATDDFTWEPGSTDTLAKGDVIEVKIDTGIPHGFITVSKDGAGVAKEDKSLVLACGETRESKPQAVLQEVDCAGASKFGVAYQGSMRLEVLDSFKDEVAYWCTVHGSMMAGTLKLKQ